MYAALRLIDLFSSKPNYLSLLSIPLSLAHTHTMSALIDLIIDSCALRLLYPHKYAYIYMF